MATTDLIARIEKLEKRNTRVEADKAWETSWFRKLSIMILTYIVVACYLHFVIHINPWINALVPVIGFFLIHTDAVTAQVSLGDRLHYSTATLTH